MRGRRDPYLCAATVALVLLAGRGVALAGPPLLCEPFDIGDAKSLPWGGPGWQAAKGDYDVRRLVDDTLSLLTPEAPVIVRMETLRRATIYAQRDRQVAADLLTRLRERASAAARRGGADALASFDFGYLAQTYGQMFKAPQPASDVDGYASVLRAIEARGGDAQMELAAAIITAYPSRPAHRQHVEKAIAGAGRDRLLARNLVTQVRSLNMTEAELRARLGSGVN
jgi:hypothetical protein